MIDKHATVSALRFLCISVFGFLFLFFYYFTPKAFDCDGKIPAATSVGVVESF